MGTQQILMIVLSVIVVGAAVAVGIQMFDTQATNSQRTAIAADLQNFGAQTLAYMRTPSSMGGGKGTATADKDNLSHYLGFSATYTYTNANGTYTLKTTAANSVTIQGQDATTGAKVDLTCTINTTPNADVATAITITKTATS